MIHEVTDDLRQPRSRAAKRRLKRRMPGQRVQDATPERLAKSEGSEFVNPAEIDGLEQRIARVRRFRDSWIDRLHRRGQLTYAQHFACDWYLRQHTLAFSSQRVVADYGNSSGGAGERNVGLPQTEAQAFARRLLLSVRTQLPAQHIRLFEAVVVGDEMPPFRNGQQRARFGVTIAAIAQDLAFLIYAPGAHLTL